MIDLTSGKSTVIALRAMAPSRPLIDQLITAVKG
jgi:hypothetical protein